MKDGEAGDSGRAQAKARQHGSVLVGQYCVMVCSQGSKRYPYRGWTEGVGHVLGCTGPGSYLVEVGAINGVPHGTRRVCYAADMRYWEFFETEEAMWERWNALNPPPPPTPKRRRK